MKKILIGCFILSAISFGNTFANGDKYLEVRAGWDISGEYSSIDNGGMEFVTDKAKSNGYELALEGMVEYTTNWDFGLGVAFQDHGERKSSNPYGFDVTGGDYSSIPVYLIAKYKFNLNSNYVPYLKTNLGYAFNFDEDDIVGKTSNGSVVNKVDVSADDGMYFAIGGGIEYNDFTMDLMYGIVKSDLSLSGNQIGDDSYSGDYDKLTLSVGYKFNL